MALETVLLEELRDATLSSNSLHTPMLGSTMKSIKPAHEYLMSEIVHIPFANIITDT